MGKIKELLRRLGLIYEEVELADVIELWRAREALKDQGIEVIKL